MSGRSLPEGRYLFIKGKLFNTMCTIANIYAPNRDPDNFLKKVLKKLEAFKEGKLMIAGDFNWSIDPRIDSSGGTPGFTTHRYEAFKKRLMNFQLLDAWKISHPKKQDYTYYSPAHKTYSRIDYILIEHQLAPCLQAAEIKAITLSDPAPVKIRLEITGPPQLEGIGN